MKKIICLLLLTILFVLDIYAEMPFFFDGARPMGMGGAFTAVADDENAIYYNPAGLVLIKEKNMSFGYSTQNYDFDFQDLQGSFVYSKRYFGIGLHSKKKNSLKYYHQELTSTVKGDDIDYETTIILSFGKQLSSNFVIGANIKYLHFNNELWGNVIDFGQNNKFNVDIGSIYSINDNITLGVSLQNIMKDNINYIIRNEFGFPIALSGLANRLNIGICFKKFDRIIIAYDICNLLEDKIDDIAEEGEKYEFKISHHLGVEYIFSEIVTVRIGSFIDNKPRDRFSMSPFDYKERINLTAGVGFNFKVCKFNIGLLNDFRDTDPDSGTNIRFLLLGSIFF